jgi:hypothetical protein
VTAGNVADRHARLHRLSHDGPLMLAGKSGRRASPVMTSTRQNVSDIAILPDLCLGPPARAGVGQNGEQFERRALPLVSQPYSSDCPSPFTNCMRTAGPNKRGDASAPPQCLSFARLGHWPSGEGHSPHTKVNSADVRLALVMLLSVTVSLASSLITTDVPT